MMESNVSLNKVLESSFKKNWNVPALSDYRGNTLFYRDVAMHIAKLHILFETAGVKKGDKISLCSRNQAFWGVSYLAALTYGAVPVPIMHEFKCSSIHHLVNHSESKILMVGSQNWDGLSVSEMPGLKAVFKMENLELLESSVPEVVAAVSSLNEMFGRRYPKDFTPDSISYHQDTPEELAMINYTSGTSGFSKGVMIPYRALYSNYLFSKWSQPQMKAGECVVAMLPTAHMYGMMYEFLFPMCMGGHVYFLTRLPTPRIIMDAMAELKPSYVISVPMVIEKIYKKQLEPMISKYGLKYLLQVPVLEKAIATKINTELTNVFGGRFSEIIIGGAAFSREAEAFFRKIHFRYTVGYGMTECSPIITYSRWNETKLYSCGKAAPRMEVRIDSPDPANVPGEILTRGDNVFLGYFKNEEATGEAFTEDGWFRTGDLGIMDEDGYLFIKGRCKSMILGSNGQNIYPEEIENQINNMPYVVESLVIDDHGKLVALIYPDTDKVEAEHLTNGQLLEKLNESIRAYNESEAAFNKIHSIEIFPEEFEKTPKKSIKRYLYQR